MQLKIYSVRDAKSESYGQMIIQRTHGEAERYFKTEVNQPEGFMGKYPEDFDLYFLGELDNVTGKLVPNDSPQHIVKGIQVKADKNATNLN